MEKTKQKITLGTKLFGIIKNSPLRKSSKDIDPFLTYTTMERAKADKIMAELEKS